MSSAADAAARLKGGAPPATPARTAPVCALRALPITCQVRARSHLGERVALHPQRGARARHTSVCLRHRRIWLAAAARRLRLWRAAGGGATPARGAPRRSQEPHQPWLLAAPCCGRARGRVCRGAAAASGVPGGCDASHARRVRPPAAANPRGCCAWRARVGTVHARACLLADSPSPRCSNDPTQLASSCGHIAVAEAVQQFAARLAAPAFAPAAGERRLSCRARSPNVAENPALNCGVTPTRVCRFAASRWTPLAIVAPAVAAVLERGPCLPAAWRRQPGASELPGGGAAE